MPRSEDALANSTSDASLARSKARSAEIDLAIDQDPSRFRVLTGDRPTGHLHLGHYFGTLRNRVLLQNRGVETWVLVADYQVITDRDGVGPIRERVLGLVADYLAAGIDPERSTIFNHSAVPALNQLMLPFLSLVTESELHRNPTVKAELEATEGRAMTGLMLTYPVHQAADILFCKANIVPVGQDQLPHLAFRQLRAFIVNDADLVAGAYFADGRPTPFPVRKIGDGSDKAFGRTVVVQQRHAETPGGV